MRPSVADAKARFSKLSELIQVARSGEPVVVTRHGEPVVAVVALPSDPEERERFLLAHNPLFRRILEASRESGAPVPHVEFWRAVEKQRSGAASGARKRRSAKHV